MNNILNGLFTGSVIPWERRASYNKEELSVFKSIEDEESYFLEKMSLEDRKRFQALSILYAKMNTIEGEHIFSYGFSLGLLLMQDVMEEAKLIVQK